MEDYFSQASISSALEPVNQRVRLLSENERSSSAVDVLLSNPFNDSSVIADLMPEIYSKASRSRVSNRTRLPSLDENVSFIDVFGDKTKQIRSHLSSLNAVEFEDEFFFSADDAKEMLLKDEENYAKEFFLKNDANCTSWSASSRKSLAYSLPKENCDNGQSNRLSVGEYIRKFSEPLGSFSGGISDQQVYFGYNCSTPKPDRKQCFEFTEVNDNIQHKPETSTYVSLYDNLAHLSIEDPTKSCMFLYSVTKKNCPEYYKYYIDTECYRKIQRLEAEERNKCSESVEKSTLTFRCLNDSTETTFEKVTGSSNMTTVTSFESIQRENGVIEKWSVRPQEITLDVNSKGYRLLLVSNSTTNLKFKTRFDSQITNVCPISGILPAKGEIGIRILVSSFIKKRFEDDIEDSVVIICGKKQKIIRVQICKQQKELLMKNRSFKCF